MWCHDAPALSFHRSSINIPFWHCAEPYIRTWFGRLRWPYGMSRRYPSVINISVFRISYFIIWPTVLKLHMMILDCGAHYRSSPISRFTVMWSRNEIEVHNFRIWISSLIIGLSVLKFRVLILDLSPHNRSVSDVLLSDNRTQNWVQSWKQWMVITPSLSNE